mmetsp:Transcript_8771/g.14936  ORF Transcript_8771/g.14936 Transcript_8771/m.14936 type:complete len:572 (+) Transcript_8771:148-1863(+)|eukprot:CAMPEP_0114435798 /NCGR_PEP_ID=MMETSP0103-20121206/13050_1 /TAXON_ID=37642 ORGANISM="Paraphysomonas imperforata, Strain PA2" /NCGR_SAMPLE_ID=MMETSP0103 /ASSEMBLY_ACC=CAM_ASM_000201 /LENGTH=571 /DNA_ID=CAMNT_0001605903 /DNA_START=96 /DNA_END=1811 /DNA_ORIENTATION=+
MQTNNEHQQPSMYNPSNEGYPDNVGQYMNSSPEEGGRVSYQGDASMLEEQFRLQQQQQDFKTHRNAKKIEGPVIPSEYSDPELQRQSSEFSAILQHATSSSMSAKRHESTFVMDISPSVVGWIIGRSGIRIKEIQSYTGCKMWVDQDVPNDQPRKIYFHGSKQSIEAAVARVNDLVQTAPILSSNHVVSGKGLTSVIVDCPVSLVGLLIGKRGWTIKKIQSASNAQISINQSVREGLPRKIIVSGDEKSVSTALNLITEVLRDKTIMGNGGDRDGYHQLTMRTAGGEPYYRDESMSLPGPPRGGHPNYDSYDHHHAGMGNDYSSQPPHPHHGYGKGRLSANTESFSPGGNYGSSPITSSSPPAEHQMRDSGGYSSNTRSFSPQGGVYQDQGQGGYHGHGGYHPQGQRHGHGQGQGQAPPRRMHTQHPPSQYQHQHQHNHRGPHGAYHQESSRMLPNQYGHKSSAPVPVRSSGDHNTGGSTSYGMSQDSQPPRAEHPYAPEHHMHSQQPTPPVTRADLAKYFLREESPNTVEASGGSFQNSTIFDFQHRHDTPPTSSGQGQGLAESDTLDQH